MTSDAVDLGKVRTGHAKQSCTQVELWLISFLLLESLLPLLFRQRSCLATIFSLLEILVELSIALGHLLLAKLVTILFLLQHKQQILLPVALQTERNLLLTGLHSRISKGCQLTRITFACQNGLNDRLSRSHRSTHWPIEYSSASAPSGCGECAAPPRAPNHSAVASTSAWCGPPAMAGTNFATAR